MKETRNFKLALTFRGYLATLYDKISSNIIMISSLFGHAT